MIVQAKSSSHTKFQSRMSVSIPTQVIFYFKKKFGLGLSSAWYLFLAPLEGAPRSVQGPCAAGVKSGLLHAKHVVHPTFWVISPTSLLILNTALLLTFYIWLGHLQGNAILHCCCLRPTYEPLLGMNILQGLYFASLLISSSTLKNDIRTGLQRIS